MIAAELLHEFLPSDGGGIFGSGTVILPPSQGSFVELVSCQEDLVSILALKRLEFPLDHTQPVICFQGVTRSGKGGRLGPQKSCQLVVHGLLSRPLVDECIGQCFQYEGLVVDYLCQVFEGWWWWQWHFSLIFSSVLAHFLFILGRVLSIRLHSRTSDCGVPNVGGPRNASGSHL